MKKIIRFFKRLFKLEVAEYVLTEDEEHAKKIKRAIEVKRKRFGKGYCPCVTPKAHSEKTICPCEEYRKTGVCHCGLYIK